MYFHQKFNSSARSYSSHRFGWTAEQVAVVPRLTPDKMCGKGNTGVVQWKANADKKFGVFCFNTSGTF